jgi:glycylpeptide N-tetradecanoyltransferase
MTLQRMLRLFRLPDETKTPGLRPMELSDIPAVKILFAEVSVYLFDGKIKVFVRYEYCY